VRKTVVIAMEGRTHVVLTPLNDEAEEWLLGAALASSAHTLSSSSDLA
jgi:hypothetical protein